MSVLLLLLSFQRFCEGRDVYYSEAMELLEDYNSAATNLTEVMRLLELSAGRSDPDGLCKLGEVLLFGFPISADHPILREDPLPAFISPTSLSFQRDFPKALDYLRQADRLGAKDSSALLSFVLKMSLLLQEFDALVGDTSDFETEFMLYHLSAVAMDSDLAKAELIAGHLQCETLQETYLPEFLNNATTPFYKVPYFDEWNGCFGSCQDVVYHAVTLASAAVKHYQAKGGVMNYDIGPLQDVVSEVERAEAASRVALLKGEAAVGNQNAAAHLADSYLFGNTEAGIDRNPGEALRYYEQAAGDGNVMAMQNLGILHLQGIGSEKNYTLALKYLQEAADAGSMSAYNGLGYIYEHGLGVERNSTKAFEYFKIAADAGYVESQSNLGIFYLNGDGVEQDFDLAEYYFSKAANAGHLPAVFNLGVMHLNGYGVKRSCSTALELFQEVFLNGELGTVIQQAYYFFKYKDYVGAYLRFAQAASLGYASAMLSAGYMWEHNHVPLTCKLGKSACAGHHYAQSALHDFDAWAFYRLGDIAYYGGDNFTSSMEDAFEMYLMGEDVPEARFNVAYMHEHGEGVPVDTIAARQIYTDLLSDAQAGIIDSSVRYPVYLSLLVLSLKETLGPAWAWLTALYNENENWY